MPQQKHPVTRRALKQRIDRVLKRQGRVLRAVGGRGDHGRKLYIATETRVVEVDVDLAELGTRLGVLASYEQLVD